MKTWMSPREVMKPGAWEQFWVDAFLDGTETRVADSRTLIQVHSVKV